MDTLYDIDNLSPYEIMEIWNKTRRCTKSSFAEFLHDNMKQPDKYIKYLNTCDCCDDHKINKPENLCIWIDLPIHNYGVHKKCDCGCKYLARWICRAFGSDPCYLKRRRSRRLRGLPPPPHVRANSTFIYTPPIIQT